jgi:hypothetical protein
VAARRVPRPPRRRADAQARGKDPGGGEDPTPDLSSATLPPFDAQFRPSYTADRAKVLLGDRPAPDRIQTLFPFLLVRAGPGDIGIRRPPLWPPIVCWESCDIHLVSDGGGAFDFARTVINPVAGQTYRVFVHIWNLGRLLAFGARLRAWWVEPGFFDGTPSAQHATHFIGGTYFELGDRDSARSHDIIEIPQTWTVQMNTAAHECLIVAVECATDPWDGNMQANTHRHVAQRNLTLIEGLSDATAAITQLAGMLGPTQNLVLQSASVTSAPTVGAAHAGKYSREGPPHGWDHSVHQFGAESIPVASITTSENGLRFHDQRRHRRIRGQDPPAEGVPVDGQLSERLPELLASCLRIPDLTAATLAPALGGGPGEPALLRFGVTDTTSTLSSGYTLLIAP